MNEANKNETSWAVSKDPEPRWLDVVRNQIASLRFGTLVITVHDGRVVQVEKSEKLRLDQTTSLPAKTEQRG